MVKGGWNGILNFINLQCIHSTTAPTPTPAPAPAPAPAPTLSASYRRTSYIAMAGTRLLIQSVFAFEIMILALLSFYFSWEDLKIEYTHPFICSDDKLSSISNQNQDKKLLTLLTIWTISPKSSIYSDFQMLGDGEENDVQDIARIFHGIVQHYHGNELDLTTNIKSAPIALASRDLGLSYHDHVEIFLKKQRDMNSDYDMNLVVFVSPGDKFLSLIWNGTDHAVTWKTLGFITHREGRLEETASLLLNQIKSIKQHLQNRAQVSVPIPHCEDWVFQKYLLVDYFFAMLSPLLAPLILPTILGLKKEYIRYRTKCNK